MTMTMAESTKKRKTDSDSSREQPKKAKITEMPCPSSSTSQMPPQEVSGDGDETRRDKGNGKNNKGSSLTRHDSRRRIKKLNPPRPFPTVPPSVSETGPRSAHREGKNMICITRKTSLGAYMRRCKEVIIEDGYVAPSCLPHPLTTADIKLYTLVQWVQLFHFSFN